MTLPIKIVATGGDSLEMLGKSKDLPAFAERLFSASTGNWDSLRGEKWQYLDRPVNDEFRLFIRYEREKRGTYGRALPYEVGFLLPREAYVAYGNLNHLHQALLSIPLSTLEECWNAAESYQLPLPADVSCVDASSSWPLRELTLRCDVEDIESDIREIASSFVAADMETWFSKLYFVVNPYKVRNEANVVISNVFLPAPERVDEQEPDSERKGGFMRTVAKRVCVLAAGAGVCACPVLNYQITEWEQRYAELQQENQELQQKNADLQQKCNELLLQLEQYKQLHHYPGS